MPYGVEYDYDEEDSSCAPGIGGWIKPEKKEDSEEDSSSAPGINVSK